MAANDTQTNAKAAAVARTPANMTPNPATDRLFLDFTSGGKAEAIAASCRQPSRFGNFCRCFNKVTLEWAAFTEAIAECAQMSWLTAPTPCHKCPGRCSRAGRRR